MIKNLLVHRNEQGVTLDINEDITQKATIFISKHSDFKNDVLVKKNICFKNGCFDFLEDEGMHRTFYKVEINNTTYIGAERRLPLKLNNCRDLGGYINQQNQMIQWGKLYRSDVLSNLDKKEIDYLTAMNIVSVIDFRSPSEIKKTPDDFIGEKIHKEFSPHAELAKEASAEAGKKDNEDRLKIEKLEQLAETEKGQQKLIKMQNAMAKQMEELVLSDASKKAYTDFLNQIILNDGPHLFHCQGGKDRTGWAAALVLGLLDVDKQTIIEDYLLTGEFNLERNKKRMDTYKKYTDNSFVLDFLASLQATKLSYIESSFEVVKEKYETIKNYAFQELDFTDEKLKKLQELYLL